MKRKLESNLWKYAVHLITNKRTFMSILGVYLLTVPGTTPKTIGFMILIGSLAGFLFEIPSGYISDKIGHKNALVIARICLLLSSTLFLIGNKVFLFIFGAVFLNLGWAFESGTAAAFMHETLRGLGRESEYSKVMGKLSSIGFAVPIILIMAVPFLVAINFKIPFAVAVLIDIVGLVVVASLVSPQKTSEEIQEVGIQNFSQVMREGWRFGFFKYAIFTAFISGIITASSNFKDVYQAALGIPIIYYGVFWGLSRVLVSALLPFNHKIKEIFSFHQFLLMKFIVATFLIFGLYVFPKPSVVVVLFILIAAFNWSFQQTNTHYLLEIIRESKFKATLLSVKAEVSTLTQAIMGFAIGFFATKTTYPHAFAYSALILVAIGLVMYSFIITKSRLRTHLPEAS